MHGAGLHLLRLAVFGMLYGGSTAVVLPERKQNIVFYQENICRNTHPNDIQ